MPTTTEQPLPECYRPTLEAVPVAEILVTDNPRTTFDQDALDELQASIAEHGIIEPLVGRRLSGGWVELICGERRLRAARALGLAAVRMIVHESLSDGATVAMRVVENLHRRDLNPIEEARGYAELKRVGYTQRDVARKLHRSEPAISNALRLLTLEQPIQDHIAAGHLSAAHGLELLTCRETDIRLELADRFAKSGASLISLRYEIDWQAKLAIAQRDPDEAIRQASYEAQRASTDPVGAGFKPAPPRGRPAAHPATTTDPAPTDPDRPVHLFPQPTTDELSSTKPTPAPAPAPCPPASPKPGPTTADLAAILETAADVAIRINRPDVAAAIAKAQDILAYPETEIPEIVRQAVLRADPSDPSDQSEPSDPAPLHTLPIGSIIAKRDKPRIKARITGFDLEDPDGPFVFARGLASGLNATITPAEADLWQLDTEADQ